MDLRAIQKANRRLNSARAAVETLKKCRDMEQFHEIWFEFLIAAKSVYTSLETGSKTTPQSRQWYGGKAAERRNDELLQYVYQARNDDEHGLGDVVEHVPGRFTLGVGPGAPGYTPEFSRSLRVENMSIEKGRITVEATSLDGKRIGIKRTPDHVALSPVDARGVVYQPPTKHLGKSLPSNLPLPVAELMIAYLAGMVAEAGKLS